MGLGAVWGYVPSDEGGRVGVLPLAKRVGFPGVRESDRVCPRVAVKGACVRVIPGYVRVEGGRGGLVRGEGLGFGPGTGQCGNTRWVNRGLGRGRTLSCGSTGRGNGRPSGGWRQGGS